MIKVVGLTGGIGSGKSTVAQMIRAAGVPVVDADVIARQITEPGRPAAIEIARTWPVADAAGGIDRKRLAAIVFSDAESRKRLEAITHPRIRAVVAEQTSALAAAGHRLAFLEAALLVETGFYRELDGLLVVTAKRETRIERVLRRDGGGEQDVLARIAAQLPMEAKVAVADYVIDNDGPLAETATQLARIMQRLLPAF